MSERPTVGSGGGAAMGEQARECSVVGVQRRAEQECSEFDGQSRSAANLMGRAGAQRIRWAEQECSEFDGQSRSAANSMGRAGVRRI